VAQLASILIGLRHGGGFGHLVHAHNPLEQRWICLGFDQCSEIARWPEAQRERVLASYGV
jgi:hypothetical protein